jgi:predicted alpha/beta-hydrolase family hydrolase
VTDEALRIDVPGKGSVSALLTRGDTAGRWLFAYAPGAGASLADPFGAFAARTLPVRGIAVLRFQFPYQEAKKSGPDPNAVLEATWSAVIEAARDLAGGGMLAVGGRSMGGRIASHVAARGTPPVDALALFAYPLHPPGWPDQMRDAHLPSIAVPTLFCCGTRDAFGSPEEMAVAAAKVPGAVVHPLEGADHGFAVPKSSGRKRDDVWQEACEALAAFLAA